MKKKLLLISFLFMLCVTVQAKIKTCDKPKSTLDNPTATMTGSTTICPGNTAIITLTGTPNCVANIRTSNNNHLDAVYIGTNGTGTLVTPTLQQTTIYSLEQVKNFFTLEITYYTNVSITITVVPNGCAQLIPNTDLGPEPSPLCNPGDCRILTTTVPHIPSTTSYQVSSIPYCARPFTGIGFEFTEINVPNEDDQWSEEVTLPFQFCFYGENYAQCSIGTNGLISFNAHEGGSYCNYPNGNIPIGTGNPNFNQLNAIMGVYQDTDFRNTVSPANRSVSYKIEGVYPCRKLIVNFYNLGQFSCQQSVGLQTSQIILYEVSNIIEVFVEKRTPCNAWENGVGVIGIINLNGDHALAAPNRDAGNWSAFNEAWRFTPTGPDLPYTFQWFENGNPISNTLTTTVCPTETSVYNAKAQYDVCGTTIDVNSSDLTLFVAHDEGLTPNDLFLCNSSTGTYTVDLTQNTSVILANVNPADYDLSYFTTQEDALNFANPITNPTNYAFTQNQTIYVGYLDNNYNCFYTKSFQLNILPPLDAPVGISPQNFTPGQTLADLVVNGTNILWYDAPVGGNLLPNTTLLQHNMTYYASQTNSAGCESRLSNSNRLAITVLNSLNTIDIDNGSFKIYPNPTKDNLTITSTLVIDTVEIYNTIGQRVLKKVTSSNNVLVDLSNISSAVYFLRVTSSNKIQTLKIVKE